MEADGFRGTIGGLALAGSLLAAWAAWFLLADLKLYELSDDARLEAARSSHPLQAPVAGRIVATHLMLGREVQTGEVLAELEPEAERLQVEEERRRLGALGPQLDALRLEIAADERALGESHEASRAAVDEARAQLREAEAVAELAAEEAQRSERLRAAGLVSEVDLLRAKADEQRRRAAAESLRLAVDRLAKGQQAQESDRQARREALRREATRLEGERATAAATIERFEHERDKRRLRAPVAGRVAEVADLQVGAFVEEGDRLGVIVPAGDLRIVAHFLPAEALGRIRPGQPARMRLEGFPWAQYGSLAATVASVASEIGDGRIRVELAVSPDRSPAIPLQHGLPGEVEVEVERISPAALVLRAAGRLVAGAVPSGRDRDDRGTGP